MIRLLYESDAAEFKKLRLETLRADPKAWLSNFEVEDGAPLSFFADRLNYWSHFPGFGYYGLFNDDTLTAYALMASNSLPNKKHIVNLSDFCVAVSEREKGVGSRLMKYLIDRIKMASEVEEVQLFVNSGNSPATNLYEKFGFKKVATLPESVKYPDGSYRDEYVYTLKI
jgi:ribosomal protein S18 acetylase RimI-like enzyme